MHVAGPAALFSDDLKVLRHRLDVEGALDEQVRVDVHDGVVKVEDEEELRVAPEGLFGGQDRRCSYAGGLVGRRRILGIQFAQKIVIHFPKKFTHAQCLNKHVNKSV